MRAVVPVPNFVDRCAIPWTRIQHRQPALQMRNRLKTPAMSIAGEIARGASDDPRSSIGTAEAARRRLRDTSLERGHGRSSARTHQARCLPSRNNRRRHAARDPGARLSRIRGGVMIAVMADTLTYVDLIWIEKRVQRWIRFGRVASEQIIDRHRSIVAFAPGDVFAFVRWASNDFGTVVSRIDILRAVRPGEPCSTVGFVRPGGESLSRIYGWPKVERVLRAIDAIEALGIDPADAAPEHWQHIHNRVSVGERPRPYTRTRHQAWLRRRKLIS